jgi:MFS family permease
MSEIPTPRRAILSSAGSSLKFAFRAFQHRNYRLFFFGQSISLIGTWMTRIAISWLVYRLTNSALLLGLVGFAGQIPTFLLGPIAGVWVDRWDRHRVLVVTQILAMIQSLWLAALALSGNVSIYDVILLSLFQGCINSFDMPARQSFVVDMVEDRQHLGSAIALNSSMFNAARLVGPSIAGVVIGLLGEGYCFLIDGLSYIAVIISLLAMRLPRIPKPAERQRIWGELRDGWSYVSGFAPIRSVLLLLAVAGFVGMPYTILMPVMASTVLGGGPMTLGLLMAASGVGAVIGVLQLAFRRSVVGLGRVIAFNATAFGVALIAFALSHHLWLSLLLMVVTGFGVMQQMAASNTFLQTIVSEDKRGRVMSFYTMALMGMAPFGSLFAGVLANRIGAPKTLIFSGVISAVAGGMFATQLPALRELVRPIYIELGIIPEVARGLQSATALRTPPAE